MPDALPATTLAIYPGLGQAPNMLACIPNGLVSHTLTLVKFKGQGQSSYIAVSGGKTLLKWSV